MLKFSAERYPCTCFHVISRGAKNTPKKIRMVKMYGLADLKQTGINLSTKNIYSVRLIRLKEKNIFILNLPLFAMMKTMVNSKRKYFSV